MDAEIQAYVAQIQVTQAHELNLIIHPNTSMSPDITNFTLDFCLLELVFTWGYLNQAPLLISTAIRMPFSLWR